MLDRSTLLVLAGIPVLLALLSPGTTLASVKCQCNNGSVVHAMGADYDDEDVDEAFRGPGRNLDEAPSSTRGLDRVPG